MKAIFLSWLLLGMLPSGDCPRIIVRPGDTQERIEKIYLHPDYQWSKIESFNNYLNPNSVLSLPIESLKEKLIPVIISSYGGSLVTPKGQTLSIPAIPGTVVEKGDSIKALIHGGVGLRFTGGRQLILRGPGKLTILENEASGVRKVKLNIGRLEVRWGKTPQRKILKILTGPATTQTEDAFFRIAIGDYGNYKIEVLEGTVSVLTQDKSIRVSSGQGLVIPSR